MHFLYKEAKLANSGSALICTLALVATSAVGATSSTQIEITATVTAVCSLTAPPSVDLGEIPITALTEKKAGQELNGYDHNFTITTSCHGTNKYALQFNPSNVNYNCLTASSHNIGYCLYGPDGKKIMLSGSQNLVSEGNKTDIKIVAMRIGTPTAGIHSALMSVTISPL